MSIKNIKLLLNREYVFEFEEEEVIVNEAHTLFPMALCHVNHLGLVFIDSNDCSVYKTKNIFLFHRGTTKTHTMDSSEFIRIGDVRDFLNSNGFFCKTI